MTGMTFFGKLSATFIHTYHRHSIQMGPGLQLDIFNLHIFTNCIKAALFDHPACETFVLSASGQFEPVNQSLTLPCADITLIPF